MPTPIVFDAAIGRQFIKYARLVSGTRLCPQHAGQHRDPDAASGLPARARLHQARRGLAGGDGGRQHRHHRRADQPDRVGRAHDQRRPQSQPRDPAAAARHQRHHPRARRRDHRAARLRRAARLQGAVARSAVRAGQAGALRAGACRRRGRRELGRGLHPGHQPRRAGRPWPDGARPQRLRGLSPAEHLHRRGAALPAGRAGRGAQGHDAGLPRAARDRGDVPLRRAHHLSDARPTM